MNEVDVSAAEEVVAANLLGIENQLLKLMYGGCVGVILAFLYEVYSNICESGNTSLATTLTALGSVFCRHGFSNQDS